MTSRLRQHLHPPTSHFTCFIYLFKTSASYRQKMCQITFFQHKACKHTWAIISEPCAPFMGFNTCPTFVQGRRTNPSTGNLQSTPKFYKTKARACPKCELDGVFDSNALRLVEKMGYGMTLGFYPDGGDWGIDLRLGTSRKCIIL